MLQQLIQKYNLYSFDQYGRKNDFGKIGLLAEYESLDRGNHPIDPERDLIPLNKNQQNRSLSVWINLMTELQEQKKEATTF